MPEVARFKKVLSRLCILQCIVSKVCVIELSLQGSHLHVVMSLSVCLIAAVEREPATRQESLHNSTKPTRAIGRAQMPKIFRKTQLRNSLHLSRTGIPYQGRSALFLYPIHGIGTVRNA